MNQSFPKSSKTTRRELPHRPCGLVSFREMTSARRNRGVTLIEILVVVALMALFVTAVVTGLGANTNAKIRSAATLIASAVKVGFTRSASTSKSTRIVFDMERHSVRLEEANMPVLVRRKDETGLSETNKKSRQELDAAKDSKRVSEGPSLPQPIFQPIKGYGFDPDDPAKGRELPGNVAIRSVELARESDPVTLGQAYLNFWPGGQTERASIQVGRRERTDTSGILSILVAPLTGRVQIVAGSKGVDRTLEERGEREDPE